MVQCFWIILSVIFYRTLERNTNYCIKQWFPGYNAVPVYNAVFKRFIFPPKKRFITGDYSMAYGE